MRLVIIEDDRLLRESLNLLLNGEKEITIEGSFSSAEDAITGLKDISPDVMLVDLGLPGLSGVELIRKVKAERPGLDIMAFTIFDDRDIVFSAIKAGASGYVLKGCTPRELVESLHELHQGGSPMSPKIARAVIREQQGGDMDDDYLLSNREKEILSEVEKGLTYKEMANRFNISSHTVHTHIKKIYEKLQARGRREALVTAREKGII